jgi:hypothetical protein
MYDDIGDYMPDTKRRSTTNERDKNNENRKKTYFHHDSKSVNILFWFIFISFNVYLE